MKTTLAIVALVLVGISLVPAQANAAIRLPPVPHYCQASVGDADGDGLPETTYFCYTPPPCEYCVCQSYWAGVDLSAAGSEWDSTYGVSCVVWTGGTIDPGAVDPSQGACVGTTADLPPAVDALTQSIDLGPWYSNPICTQAPCAPLPTDHDGAVGDTEDYGNAMAGIGCDAAQGASAVANEAAGVVTGYVGDVSDEIAGFQLYAYVPAGEARDLEAVLLAQANAQGDQACAFLLGTNCAGGAAPAAPGCIVPVTGGNGVLGDAVNYAVAACGTAYAGATDASNAIAPAVPNTLAPIPGDVAATQALANGIVAATSSAAQALTPVAQHAGNVVTSAANAACDATAGFALGQTC